MTRLSLREVPSSVGENHVESRVTGSSPMDMTDTQDVNPIIKIILQLGVPAAIAVYFVYWLTSSVAVEMRDFNVKLDGHMNATVAIQQGLQQLIMKQEETISVLRQTCVNQAKGSVPAQDRCFAAGR